MADDLYYPDLSGDEASKAWVNAVRDAIRILFDSVYELGGRKGQAATFANQVKVDGDLKVAKKGGGLQIAESGTLGIEGQTRSDATMGIVTLDPATSTAVVTSSQVHQESRIFLTPQSGFGSGALSITARETGKSFTITSSEGQDARVIAWLIVQPHGAADTATQVPTTDSQTSQVTPAERPQRDDPEWIRQYNRRKGAVMLP